MFPLLNLPPAGVKALSPGTAGKYRQVCICACLWGEREREKKTLEGWMCAEGLCVCVVWVRLGGGVKGLLGSAVFSHTALTKTSLFSRPVTQGDALMIARCLSQGSRLDFSSKRSFSSFCLLLPFCLGAPHINPLVVRLQPNWHSEDRQLTGSLRDFSCSSFLSLFNIKLHLLSC